MADIHGPKTQSGGSTGSPVRRIYAATISSGEPEKTCSAQPSGRCSVIDPRPNSKRVTRAVSAYTPSPESVQKKGMGQ